MSFVARFAKLTLDAVSLMLRGESVRRSFAVTMKEAAVAEELASKGLDLDAWVRGFVAAVRKEIKGSYPQAVQQEYDAHTDKDRAELVKLHTDSNPSFRDNRVAELHSRMMVLKVRASEAKRILAADLEGHPSTEAFYAGDLSATALLEILANKADAPAKDEAGGAESDEVTDGNSDDAPFTPDAFRAALAGLIQGAEKAGFLADALGIMAEVAQSVTVPVTPEA
jgi:hypothetical protein